MTVDQSIALFASLGACLSAVATFLTVRQIARQREATYLPELVFSRFDFAAVSDPDSARQLPSHWADEGSRGAAPASPLSGSVALRNVGLGSAKSVEITWSFPIEQVIERINTAAQRTLTPAYFSYDAGAVNIKSNTLGNAYSLWKNQQKVLLDFVLPASVQKEPTLVDLPPTYVLLCSAAVFLAFKDKELSNFCPLPPLIASIEYIDIGNRKRHAVFQLDFHLNLITDGGGGFHGYLESKKSDQTGKIRRKTGE